MSFIFILISSSFSFLEINYFNGYVSIIVIFIIIIIVNLFEFGLNIVEIEKALWLINATSIIKNVTKLPSTNK